MATEVASSFDVTEPIITRNQLVATNHAGMMTEIDCGESGSFGTDEPEAHGVKTEMRWIRTLPD